ncbi:hypothetical protein PEC331060_20210 [Pectobacterium carotovorum subsp. carotovorum]|nr:hypothetical protein PEC301653_18330 [Pectobacterium carotovorum subsp. carotovorum]GKW28843.1 hypothetical protein PEC331060_20210 [Pectobacterium carotovorum subsp. carotovorum]
MLSLEKSLPNLTRSKRPPMTKSIHLLSIL